MANEVMNVIDEREVLGVEFRIYGTFDRPLFQAKDVADIIDYARTGKGARNVAMMLKSVDEDEKLVSTILVSGQKREAWFLTEDGLYEVLMQSRKPIAKQFKKKVKEILKEIRRTGQYVAKPMDSYMIEDPIERAKVWIKEEENRIALTAQVETMLPKARECEKFIEHGHIIGFRELAKELKVKQSVLRYIVDVILDWRYKSGKRYVPYQQTITDGYMAGYDYCNDENGFTGVNYGFTVEGRMRIEEELEESQEVIAV